MVVLVARRADVATDRLVAVAAGCARDSKFGVSQSLGSTCAGVLAAERFAAASKSQQTRANTLRAARGRTVSEPELNHEFVQQYLQAKGWKSHQSRRAEVGIWRTADGSEEVQVPLTRELGDYALTLRRVAESIARVEARDVSRVLGDLARPRADAVRFGLVGDAELQASWSPLLPSTVPATPIRVEHELYERIELLGDRLRASSEPEREELIVALVSRLSGAPDGQGRMAGEVILTPVFPKGLRRLNVRLSADQYELAGEAHLRNAYVRTGGTLRRTGRTLVLSAQDFVLMTSE